MSVSLNVAAIAKTATKINRATRTAAMAQREFVTGLVLRFDRVVSANSHDLARTPAHVEVPFERFAVAPRGPLRVLPMSAAGDAASALSGAAVSSLEGCGKRGHIR